MSKENLRKMPSWAPPVLLSQIDMYKKILDSSVLPNEIIQEAKTAGMDLALDSVEFSAIRFQTAIKDSIEIYITLCTHPNMIDVWKRLTNKIKNGELLISCPENGEDDYPIALSLTIQEGLWGASGWEKLPHGEANNKRKEMQKTFEEMADQLEKYRIVFSIFQVFTEKEYHGMQRFFSGDGNIEPKAYDAYSALLCPTPTIPDILRRLAGILEVSASEHGISESQFGGVSNTKNIELRLFVKKIAAHFVEFFGSPMHDTVAALGMVFFPDSELDARKVSSIIGK